MTQAALKSAIVLLVVLAMQRSTVAGVPGFELDCLVDQQLAEEVYEVLGLSPLQKDVAARSFERYLVDVAALQTAIPGVLEQAGQDDVRASNSAWHDLNTEHANPHFRRQRIQMFEVDTGTDFESLPIDEQDEVLAEWRVQKMRSLEDAYLESAYKVGAARAQLHRKANQLLDDWLAMPDGMLTREQLARVEDARRHVRVRCEVALRRKYRGHGFLGRTTLFEVVDYARATEVELQAFLIVDEESAATQLAIQAVIERYAVDFDAEAIAGRRVRRTATKRSSMMVTPEEMEARRHRWSRRFTRLDSAASEIGAVLSDVDASAALRWHRHYLAELCPDLTRERWPDNRLAEWTQTQGLTAQQHQAAVDIEQRWQARKWALIETAFAAGVRAMKAHATTNGSNPKQLIYRQRCQEYDAAVLDVVAEVAAILSAEQQRALAAEVEERNVD